MSDSLRVERGRLVRMAPIGVAAAAFSYGFWMCLQAASLGPLQPEYRPSGGACQYAPCGTLEDHSALIAAWHLWWRGAALLVVGHLVFATLLPSGPFGWRRPRVHPHPSPVIAIFACCIAFLWGILAGVIGGLHGFFGGATAELVSGLILWIYLSWLVEGQRFLIVRFALLRAAYVYGTLRLWLALRVLADEIEPRVLRQSDWAVYLSLFIACTLASLLGFVLRKRSGDGGLRATRD